VKLDAHTRRYDLGRAVQSPIDVILDSDHALIVQPDVVFVSKDRSHICRERVWGAPDLVVEILSVGTSRHDTKVKVGWYQQYGVRECWLVDPVSCEIVVRDLTAPESDSRVFAHDEIVRSRVLPRLRLRTAAAFQQ
jgi:Uma2 family endonuclease